jgi:hypothetical protein
MTSTVIAAHGAAFVAMTWSTAAVGVRPRKR